MAAPKKPGSNTGKDGGIYRQVDQKGKGTDNFAAVPDNRQLPPTTKPGHAWIAVKRTPNSTR